MFRKKQSLFLGRIVVAANYTQRGCAYYDTSSLFFYLISAPSRLYIIAKKKSTLSQIKKYIISINRAEIFAHKNEQVKSHLLILFYRAEMAFQRWLNPM